MNYFFLQRGYNVEDIRVDGEAHPFKTLRNPLLKAYALLPSVFDYIAGVTEPKRLPKMRIPYQLVNFVS